MDARFFRRAFIFWIGLMIIYGPALHGSFLWDDASHVPVRNDFYTLQGLYEIWHEPAFTQQYYPLTFSVIWLAHHVWGAHPFGYHCLTLAVHAAAAAILWSVLIALALPGAGWVTVLWALHPIQVESVAWISELKNTLSGLFYFSALWAALRFWRSDKKRDALLAFVLFIAAILSKTVSCTLPVVLAIILWWKKGALTRRDTLRLAPLLLIALLAGLRTVGWERTYAGASGPGWDYSTFERLQIAGRAFWFYIGKLLWPQHLTFLYPKWDVHPSNSMVWLPALATGLVLLFLVGARRWIHQGPLAATLIYTALIAPALGFFNVYPMRYSFVADHFQYLAGVAILALGVAGTLKISDRLRIPRTARRAGGLFICAVLALMTWRRAHAFSSSELLWRETLRGNPTSLAAQVNLANELRQTGRFAEGRALLLESQRLYPEDLNVQMCVADMFLHQEGDPRSALARAQGAVRAVDRLAPGHARDGFSLFAHHLLAETLFQSGDEDAAVAEYKVVLTVLPALRKQPFFDAPPEVLDALEDDSRGHLNALRARHELQIHKDAGRLYANSGRWEDAVEEYRQAVDLNPEAPGLHRQLAQALLKLHRVPEAAQEFLAAAHLRR